MARIAHPRTFHRNQSVSSLIAALHQTVKWLDGLIRVLVARPVPSDLENDIVSVFGAMGVRLPRILHTQAAEGSMHVDSVFPFSRILWVPERLPGKMERREFQAVIAHEAYHVKMHAGVLALADRIAQWTLFGRGFLSAIYDSRKLEFAADRSALDYLRKGGLPKEILVSGLEKTAAFSSLSRHMARSSSLMAVGENGLKREADGWTWKQSLRWHYEIYFGDLVVSYIHPTLDERIERIEALP